MDYDKNRKINAISLLGTHVCWAALDLFISTFLIAQLLFITDGNMAVVCYFYLVFFTALFVFYALGAYVVKRFGAVWVIRFGVLLNVIVIGLLCAFYQNLESLYLIFAATSGISAGVFWIGANGFTAQTMGGTAMLRFQTYYNIAISAAKIVLPFTLGSIIHYVSFFVAIIIAVVIGVVLVAFTFLMRGKHIERGNQSLCNYFKVIRRDKLCKPVALNFVMQLFRSLTWGGGLCVVILIALYFGDSFSLGYLTSIFAAGAIVLLTIYRLIKSRVIKNNVFLACVIIAIGLSLGLLFEVSKTTIILFQLASAVFLIVVGVETGKMQMDVMKDLGKPELSTESIVVLEFAYLIGRLTYVGLILLAYVLDSFLMFTILAASFTACAIVVYILFRLWWKHYRNVIPRIPFTPKQKKIDKSKTLGNT